MSPLDHRQPLALRQVAARAPPPPPRLERRAHHPHRHPRRLRAGASGNGLPAHQPRPGRGVAHDDVDRLAEARGEGRLQPRLHRPRIRRVRLEDQVAGREQRPRPRVAQLLGQRRADRPSPPAARAPARCCRAAPPRSASRGRRSRPLALPRAERDPLPDRDHHQDRRAPAPRAPAATARARRRAAAAKSPSPTRCDSGAQRAVSPLNQRLPTRNSAGPPRIDAASAAVDVPRGCASTSSAATALTTMPATIGICA